MTLARRTLGSSTLEVSPLALGSWRTFERIPKDAAVELIGHARERGINFFDDARYDDETGDAPLASGYSEVLFGEVFRAAGIAPQDSVVSNKLWWEHWPRQSAAEELQESLARMRFERIDLIYAVTLPDGLGVEHAVAEVAGLLRSGRARAWGVANWSAEQLLRACDAAAREAIPMPCAAQLPYSLIDRASVEDPRMQEALEVAGAGLVPSNVLAGGALTGKYGDRAPAAEQAPAGRLAATLDDPALAPALAVVERLRELADEFDATPAALAIAFALAHPRTASVLVGATTAAQVDQNVAAVELLSRLSDERLERLRALRSDA